MTVAQILAEELFPDRTTAAQVLKDKDLTGQVALVTGGNSGEEFWRRMEKLGVSGSKPECMLLTASIPRRD